MLSPPARRRLARRCALLALAALAGCSGSGSPDPTPVEQFDALWRDFDATYPYFTLKGVDWEAARAAFRPRAQAAAGQEALAAVLVELLAPLRDQHVVLRDPSGRARPTFVSTAFRNHDPAVWATYAARWGVTAHGNWGHGLIGQVPYLYVADWGGPLAGIDQALEGFRDAPALVIDVRMNPGGNNRHAFDLAGRLADQVRVAGRVRYRNGPGHDDFGPYQAMEVAPAGAWQFTRPVLLLVGAGSASSTEDFASAMRELPHVTLAGDTTAGASANPRQRALAGGWSYTVSTWYFVAADGLVVEGHGIPPHVPVAAAAADFAAGVDPVLDWAEGWAASPAVLRP